MSHQEPHGESAGSALKTTRLDGLPGVVSPVALTLPKGLPVEDWARTLRLIGHISRASPWWGADALLYGERTFQEGQFSQFVEELGWAHQTAMNAMWVARAIPPKDRLDYPLTFGHHATVAALSPGVRDVWLAKALEGDGGRTWSVTRLRTELRSLKSPPPRGSGPPTIETGMAAPPTIVNLVTTATTPDSATETTAAPASAASPSWASTHDWTRAIALGSCFDIPDFGRAEVTAISLGPVAAVVTLVKVAE